MADDTKLAGAYADPSTLLIVGLDAIPETVDATDLEDPDRLGPPKEGLILSIMTHGVREPVMCRSVRWGKSDRGKIVVNGRQRVMAARAANERIKAAGGDYPVKVPYVIVQGDEMTVVLTNTWRTDLSIIQKARKAKRLKDFGHDMTEICAAFEHEGKTVSPQTISNWLNLLTLPPDTLKEVTEGSIPPSAAYELARAPVEKRSELTEKAKRPPGQRKKSEGLTPKQLLRYQELFAPDPEEPYEDEAQAVAGAVLRWIVTGDPEVLAPYPSIYEHTKTRKRVVL